MTSSNSQMHNDIMAAGSKEHPPMLAHQCIEKGPRVFGQVKKPVEGENTKQEEEFIAETYQNTTDVVWKLIDAEAKAVHMILNRICSYIYSTVDACPNAKEMWIDIERLQQGESINIQDNLDKISYHKLFEILKQHQNEVNEIHAERIARNAIPLALVAATQNYPDEYYQAPQARKPYKTHAPSLRQTTSIR
ncbi:hypothetical protein Tco_1553222 [Tanacetum coccineum]